MIKAVIFDLGRVLVTIDFVRGLLERIGGMDLNFNAVAELAGDSDFIDFSTGRITPEIFYTRIIAKTGLKLDFNEFCSLWCAIFGEMKGMHKLVSILSSKYRLGLLSDTDPLHWGHICNEYPWIPEFFPEPALSYQTGVMKPDFRAFEAAVAAVGVPAHECLFIDDLEKNVNGAREYGLNALRFTDAQKLKADLAKEGIFTEV